MCYAGIGSKSRPRQRETRLCKSGMKNAKTLSRATRSPNIRCQETAEPAVSYRRKNGCDPTWPDFIGPDRSQRGPSCEFVSFVDRNAITSAVCQDTWLLCHANANKGLNPTTAIRARGPSCEFVSFVDRNAIASAVCQDTWLLCHANANKGLNPTTAIRARGPSCEFVSFVDRKAIASAVCQDTWLLCHANANKGLNPTTAIRARGPAAIGHLAI